MNKFRKVNKKMVVVLLIGILFISMSAPATKAFAYTVKWSNEYRFYSPNDRTPSATKWTKSYVYMSTSSITSGFRFNSWVMAKGKQSGPSRTVDGPGVTKYVNYAVEDHGTGVGTYIASKRFANGSASGTWQPDK
ncbi:hypothetical protein [Listeria grandensis]|uniref:hypothetical protein n=1 Tax=Listeria grandensis TaxID=1494963 RepID=UPI00164DD4EC|nr:hypothetical protein [Listeria grandensis]MBC6316001.1 hypothetical protein [Listeria grandensis]